MSEDEIIYRSVFSREYGLAEFSKSVLGSIDPADCINIQQVNITFCGVYNNTAPARKRMVEEKGRDGSIALISNYRQPLQGDGQIRTPQNQNLVNKFPSITTNYSYCPLLLIDGPPDGVIFFELPFSFNAKIKTVNTVGCALMFNPKTTVQTRANFCRDYGLDQRIVLTN